MVLFHIVNLLLQQSIAEMVGGVVGPVINSLQGFIELTLAQVIGFLMILAISLQIARGYFFRVLRKFTLRLAADIWWLAYVLLRAGAIFLVLLLGVPFLWPSIYQDYAIGVPFMPVAINFYAAALVLILLKDTDEDPKLNQWLTILIAMGTALYFTGLIAVTMSPLRLITLPATISASTSNPWGFMYAHFNSQTNQNLAIYTFYISALALAIEGGIALWFGIVNPSGNIAHSYIKIPPKPVVNEEEKSPNPMQSAPANQEPAPKRSNP